MNYYPVIIPTLCRYEHLKRCIDSLAKNTHADKTELIISLDYPAKESHREGYEKILTYIDSIKGFKKVTCLKQDHNVGVWDNLILLFDYAYTYYDAVIFTEDDNEFSPCFLDYMDKALDKYWKEDKVTGICGYLPIYYGNNYNKEFFTLQSSSWGWGQWKHKCKLKELDVNKLVNLINDKKNALKIFTQSPRTFSQILDMIKQNAIWEDVYFTALNILNDTYQLRPNKTMVKNWGIDGSGEHCGKSIRTMSLFQNTRLYSKNEVSLHDIDVKCSLKTKFIIFSYFAITWRERLSLIAHLPFKYIDFLKNS